MPEVSHQQVQEQLLSYYFPNSVKRAFIESEECWRRAPPEMIGDPGGGGGSVAENYGIPGEDEGGWVKKEEGLGREGKGGGTDGRTAATCSNKQ